MTIAPSATAKPSARGKIAAMNSSRYVHLRLHSEYSITDGIVRIADAVKAASADAMPALALTDLGNLFGLIKFYSSARGKGLKPIAGADVWMSGGEAGEPASRLLLLVRNRQGYRQLCELLTRAYVADGRRDRAEIRREWLLQIGCDGLIALSGGHQGDVGEALLNGNFALATERALAWMRDAASRGYLPAQTALGRVYLGGLEEMGADPAEAEKWLLVASGRGDKEAAKLLIDAQKAKQSEVAYQRWKDSQREQSRNFWLGMYEYQWQWRDDDRWHERHVSRSRRY